MSQIQIPSSSQPPPPQVPTTFHTDSGDAVPALNILNVFGIDSITNNDNGITTTGSGNTVDIILSNRTTGTTTTNDATLTTILTVSLGATPGVFHVYGNVQAFDSVTPNGAGYSFSGAFLTDGATATEIGSQYNDQFETVGLATADIFISASGNNAIVQVQGVIGLNLNWNSLLEYRQVT